MKIFWAWRSRDREGKIREWMTEGPDVPEEAMRRHLQGHYRNLEVFDVHNALHGKPVEYKPSTGIVECHTFDYGIIESLERELGINRNDAVRKQNKHIRNHPIPLEEQKKSITIKRATIPRKGIL